MSCIYTSLKSLFGQYVFYMLITITPVKDSMSTFLGWYIPEKKKKEFVKEGTVCLHSSI